MKIGNTDGQFPLRDAGKTNGPEDRRGPSEARSPGAFGAKDGAVLDLSDLLSRVQEAKERALSENDVRTERIDQVKKKLDEGELDTPEGLKRLSDILLGLVPEEDLLEE